MSISVLNNPLIVAKQKMIIFNIIPVYSNSCTIKTLLEHHRGINDSSNVEHDIVVGYHFYFLLLGMNIWW